MLNVFSLKIVEGIESGSLCSQKGGTVMKSRKCDFLAWMSHGIFKRNQM